MVKNIVFDMGGVLIDFNSERTLKEFFPEKYHSVIRENVFNGSVWRNIDKGVLTFDEAIPFVLNEIPKETHSLVTEMLTDFYPYMPVFPDMYGFIERIKKAGYKVYLLSNASPRVFDRYFDIPALSLMDGLFISCLYKILKPDLKIYEAFCNKFSLKPEECFFIDDVPKNIDGAKNYGMKGFVYKAPDLTALENALNAEGVIF